MWPWYPQKSQEGTDFPGTGILGGGEPPFGCYKPNPSPLQPMILTTEQWFPSQSHFSMKKTKTKQKTRTLDP